MKQIILGSILIFSLSCKAQEQTAQNPGPKFLTECPDLEERELYEAIQDEISRFSGGSFFFEYKYPTKEIDALFEHISAQYNNLTISTHDYKTLEETGSCQIIYHFSDAMNYYILNVPGSQKVYFLISESGEKNKEIHNQNIDEIFKRILPESQEKNSSFCIWTLNGKEENFKGCSEPLKF